MQLEALFKTQDNLLLEELWDAPKAFLLHDYPGPILIIAGSEERSRIFEDLTYFAPSRILELPSWETLPSEEIAPSPDLIGARFRTLSKLNSKSILVAPLQAVLQKVPPLNILKNLWIHVRTQDEWLFDEIPKQLQDLGYKRVSVVSDKGEFALRGYILDIFPLNTFDPYRIEFFGDEVEQIRSFDPASQKSLTIEKEVEICPASEKILLEKEKITLFSYFPSPPLVVFDDCLAIEDKMVALKSLNGPGPSDLLTFDTFYSHCQKRLFFLNHRIDAPSKEEVSFEMFNQAIKAKRLHHFFSPIDLEEIPPQYQTTIITTSRLEEKAARDRFPIKAQFKRGHLSSGYIDHKLKKTLLPASEILGRKTLIRPKMRSSYALPQAEFHQLKVGDPIVHLHNGIGKFCGIEKQKNHLGIEEEFMILEYAKCSKLYVPLSQSHLISRYIGSNETTPSLHVLGTNKWQLQKQKSEKAIVGYAKEMLALQARRESKGGFSHGPDSDELALFEEDFPFQETLDQSNAIFKVKEDLRSEKAMDRLICGDVGYGKTEVAMRAAFKAVIDGSKQVAVLVPTTVLAMQHFENFKTRMKDFPINVAVLSRFVKAKEIKKTLEGVQNGGVDIVIGTHRLVSPDVIFKNLGLIIIDEEQRFGVRVKEHLKKAKESVDCLTLSATPIPRTLYMSLVGARSLSTITTPPQDRLPIKTIISEHHNETIKNAFLRELARDGQGYYIHNRVETIFEKANELQSLLPSAKILVVHGQMAASEIDSIFHKFKAGDIDILVATTIVENGIDIPNANTILIDRAHTFGMADLYQLRGRVGRWNRPAYAYFLVPKKRILQQDAKERLQALVESSGYGGGMKLAIRDLEIRGAGDILGTQQAGHVSSIGFHLYCKLLKRTIHAILKNEKTHFVDTRIEFKLAARLSEDYIRETSIRLEIYHRLGEMADVEEVDELAKELKDRFGSFAIETSWLLSLTKLRIMAQAKGIFLMRFEKISVTIKWQGPKKAFEKCLPYKIPSTPEKFIEDWAKQFQLFEK
ncbi:MAG: transcription-repair coupling factor [Simkaniaceae bacterium]